MMYHSRALLLVSAVWLSTITYAQAQAFTITDMAGRKVHFEGYPSRIVISEGRLMYGIAAITEGNPFTRLLGWSNDLIKYDPDSYRRFAEVYPADTRRMIDFGGFYFDDFNTESAITNDVDLLIVGLGFKAKLLDSGIVDTLEKAGISVVFVDVTTNAVTNTIPSLLLLGKILNEEKGAAAFAQFYQEEMDKVTRITKKMNDKDKPLVFIEISAGLQDCCITLGRGDAAHFIELAGGHNFATQINRKAGANNNVSLEAIIAANPEQIVVTGGNWAATKDNVKSVLLGYDGDFADNKKRINALANRMGFKELDAVKAGNFHAINHMFFKAPYHFIEVQRYAKWFHPEQFPDLNPDATFAELHRRFLPFAPSGQFWLSADKTSPTQTP